MTRKDYVMLAAALKAARDHILDVEPGSAQRDLLDGVYYATDRIVDALTQGNPLFDAARFLKASGYGYQS